MVLVGAEGCTHTPVHLHEPRGCLRLSGGDPVGFHPGAAECDPTLSPSLVAPRPAHGQPRRNQRQGQCLSPLQTLSHTHARAPNHPPPQHTLTHFWGRVNSQMFFFTPFHPGSISCLARACCSHVTLTDSRMNDLFGVWGAAAAVWRGGCFFQLSEMDGINRGFVLADESGDLPL